MKTPTETAHELVEKHKNEHIHAAIIEANRNLRDLYVSFRVYKEISESGYKERYSYWQQVKQVLEGRLR